MQSGLYSPSDGVYILHFSDFTIKDGVPYVNQNVFHGPGVIKAYAPWCPHCQNKVEAIRSIAKELNRDFHSAKVYVFNADGAENFRNVKNDKGEPMIAGFPTMLYVDEHCKVSTLRNSAGEQVYSIPDVLHELCRLHSDTCSVKEQSGGGNTSGLDLAITAAVDVVKSSAKKKESPEHLVVKVVRLLKDDYPEIVVNDLVIEDIYHMISN